jgi:flagellar basal body-associated protein FliL
MTPEEIEEVKKEVEREINTQAVRGEGWLDDVDDVTNNK